MVTSETLENQTNLFEDELRAWPVANLSFRPSPGEWSALQVMEHLVKTEEGILTIAQEGARNPHRIGTKDRLGFLFIMKVFQTDRKVKTPASAAQVLPGPELDLNELHQRWRKTRLDFKTFAAQLTPAQTRSGLFRHPVAGWMGTPQIVDFFWVHIVHHNFQLRRNQRAAGV